MSFQNKLCASITMVTEDIIKFQGHILFKVHVVLNKGQKI